MDGIPIQPNVNATFSDQRTQSVIANRSHVKIAPKYGGQFRAGDTVRLEIPSQDWLDPDLFSISFNAKIFQANGQPLAPYGAANGAFPRTATEAVSCRFDSPLQMLFTRAKLLQGSTVIEDILDYGTLFKMLSVATVNRQYLNTMGNALEGHYDTADYQQSADAKQRQAWGDVAATSNTAALNHPLGDGTRPTTTAQTVSATSLAEGWYYNVRPLFGLFRAGKYLPLKWMGQLTIELYLGSNESCLVSSTTYATRGTNPDLVGSINTNDYARSYTFTNAIVATGTEFNEVPSTIVADYDGATYRIEDVNMECHFVQPIDEYDRSALSLIEEKGLEIWFDTFSTHNKQISTNGSRTTSNFQERAVSLKGGYVVMQNEQDLVDYRTPASFPDNYMQEFQFKLGSQYYPAQPIKTDLGASQALAQLQTTFDAYGDLATTGTVDMHNFCGTRIVTDAGGGQNPQNVGRTLAWREIRAENSLPNQFIMALNLEKTPDQLSGFNSAAASVDVELITSTRSADAMPAARFGYGATRIASTLNAGHTFQPSKFLTHHVYQSAGLNLMDDARTADRPLSLYEPALVKEMNTKPANNYCRLTFFGHIDSVIKIARVGNLEVMR